MPNSCKCILDRMVFKGAMTEEERDKIMRNLKTNDRELDLVAKQILADLAGMSVNDDINAISKRIIFGDAEKRWSLTGNYFENDVLAPEASHDNKDKVIVVQLDCLMGKDRLAAFRKELLSQMEEGLVVIPPWAHVTYVGDECTVEIKELETDEKAEEALKILEKLYNDFTMRPDECKALDWAIRFIKEHAKEGEE
ncbi:MAG: hypothetical protein J6U54_13385 [Clostridiales bacterium]|nr:hypothetical protein [Clostridiales bacterium]